MNQQTIVWKIDKDDLRDNAAIAQAAELLKKQEVVAFPTETVYGLGADATKEEAVAKIFAAKGRPADNPLIVHVSNKQQIKQLVTSIPEVAARLIATLLPGPLTLILPSNGRVADNVTAGLDTVAIRMPNHPVAKALLDQCELPLAAPSSNQSGRPSPTTADHVYHDLNGKIAGLIDGGPTGIGLESTVLDCTSELPIILRPGGVTREEIERVIGKIMVDPGLAKKEDKPKAPGMKYTHYAPDAPLFLVEGDVSFFQAQIDTHQQLGNKVGAMVSMEQASLLKADVVKTCGSKNNLTEVAVSLYDTLRAFKSSEVDIILCEGFSKHGVGEAVMNRLEKAASKKITQFY